ncbi:MAG: hypothetical protein M1820_007708 [Bogoriella megaspora]|nr:MAG: hypothetical protein M1820_007708 [Bogoriella megaspora]
MEAEAVAASIEVANDGQKSTVPNANLTPPASEDMEKVASSSDLSDIDMDDEDDIGEVEPDHYWEGGRVPVFKPTMKQFKSFKKFVDKIDKYGMRSGIVKVIPPQEWQAAAPHSRSLDEAVKSIKIKNPITQEFSGSHGTYTQANIEKQRSYNLPQWKALTDETQHQPPARRGERRRNQAKIVRGSGTKKATASRPPPAETPEGVKRKPGRPGRPRKHPLPAEPVKVEATDKNDRAEEQSQEPPTPVSPPKNKQTKTRVKKEHVDSPSKGVGRQPKSVSSRRMNNREEKVWEVDEAAFEDFNYKLEDIDEYTPERCAELEEKYWKSLTFAPPMYGGDMPGSLFDDGTTSWNVAQLENLLDVLGTKVPGVNTTYLYLGMWKATFAWHLEDVDLYSINYIHFGAPKQWYSISQEDARKFEAAMKNVWPQDAKNCDQFLRHKTYLISPALLKSQYNITVNKLVHYEGEFVITFPYGYHSGYNIGYNCAESVNFATDAWLEYGKIAKKCHCEADSVWVDVGEIERKLRGEPTPEYYETDDDDDDDDMDDLDRSNLPSPPSSVAGRPKAPSRKRKRDPKDKDSGKKVKRLKLKLRAPSEYPCILCPNNARFDEILPTDNGKKAHRLCGLLTPETWVADINGKATICNVGGIDKARYDLKCLFCRSRRGACFQCGTKKCTRAYHATCAQAAGVDLDFGDVPTFGEDGTEYFMDGYHARCRFHRPKRPKNVDGDFLEKDKLVKDYAKSLQPKTVVQAQVGTGEVFAGVVVENRPAELTVVLDVLPEGAGDRLEIEWKWLTPFDPAKSERPKPSEKAIPLPAEISQTAVSTQNQKDGPPEMGEPFLDNTSFRWQEYNTATQSETRNAFQVKVDLSKLDQLWHYLGKISTEARAKYTQDLKIPRHNDKSNFLESVRPPPPPPQFFEKRPLTGLHPPGVNIQALNGAMANARSQAQARLSTQPQKQQRSNERPYEYKPRTPIPTASYSVDAEALKRQKSFLGQGASSAQRAALPPLIPASRPDMNGPTMYMGQAAYGGPARSSQAQPQHHPSTQPSIGASERRPSQSQADMKIDPILLQQMGASSSNSFPAHSPYSASSKPPHAHPMQQQAPVAPMAVMGGGNAGSPATTNPFTPPPSRHSGQSQPTPKQSPPTDFDYLGHLQKYPYLRNSYLRKPKNYVSPYNLYGGFSSDYAPNPPKPTLPVPRSQSAGRPPSSHSHQPYEQAHAKYAQPMKPEPHQYQSVADFQHQLSQEARKTAPETASLERVADAFRNTGGAVEGSTTPQATQTSPQRPIASPLSDLGAGIIGVEDGNFMNGNIDPALIGGGGGMMPITMPAMETWKYG